MSALAWIALCMLGVHLVAAFILVIYARQAVGILKTTSQEIVAQGNDIRDHVVESSTKVNAVTGRFKTAAQVLLDDPAAPPMGGER